MKNNFEKPNKALFDQMRQAIKDPEFAAKLEKERFESIPENIQNPIPENLPTEGEAGKDSVIKQKGSGSNFKISSKNILKTGAGAMHDWEKEKERKEDERNQNN